MCDDNRRDIARATLISSSNRAIRTFDIETWGLVEGQRMIGIYPLKTLQRWYFLFFAYRFLGIIVWKYLLEISSYLNVILNGKLNPLLIQSFNYSSPHCHQNKIIITSPVETRPERSCDGIRLPVMYVRNWRSVWNWISVSAGRTRRTLAVKNKKNRFSFVCVRCTLCPSTSRSCRREKS